MFPPMFFGPPEIRGSSWHHDGARHHPGGPHFPPHPPPPFEPHGLSMAPRPWRFPHGKLPHHIPMHPLHHLKGTFHNFGLRQRSWFPPQGHHIPATRCPLRGPRDHQAPPFMKPSHTMAASWKLTQLIMHAITDSEWWNNYYCLGAIGPYEVADDKNVHGSIWVDLDDGKKTTQLFVGPYVDGEVRVISEDKEGIRVEASHVHGTVVVASMLQRVPTPFTSSYTITSNHTGPMVVITATKAIESETSEEAHQTS